ncbi:hypothetical protein ACFPIJ_18685 [Dactylosporangium cerinum]|uniref:Tetratricopeptide repeat protein n=1 Tax=Dactylosporangium cerinum TaxID=1434730 RepID=A0ABV9VUQ4_9ACTN
MGAVAAVTAGRPGEAITAATEAVALYQQLGGTSGNLALLDGIIRTMP